MKLLLEGKILKTYSMKISEIMAIPKKSHPRAQR